MLDAGANAGVQPVSEMGRVCIVDVQPIPEYYLQPDTVYSLIPSNARPSIGSVRDVRVGLEREVSGRALARFFSLSGAHSALAHLLDRWMISYIDRITIAPDAQPDPEYTSLHFLITDNLK